MGQDDQDSVKSKSLKISENVKELQVLMSETSEPTVARETYPNVWPKPQEANQHRPVNTPTTPVTVPVTPFTMTGGPAAQVITALSEMKMGGVRSAQAKVPEVEPPQVGKDSAADSSFEEPPALLDNQVEKCDEKMAAVDSAMSQDVDDQALWNLLQEILAESEQQASGADTKQTQKQRGERAVTGRNAP
ncbi:hypothetical protein NP493_1277g00097 [Ridgeia piscesae]|uniref:Uncharacterized protein n=1 Tax=Ridgeia piscesae TaxID=27915 RepID=A0AAD9KAB3_RIDPI|nr:hypothetical protein NP493_1277g00097 [Ridgeia piscesae]